MKNIIKVQAFISIFLLLLISCKPDVPGGNDNVNGNNNNNITINEVSGFDIEIEEPASDSRISVGDTLTIVASVSDSSIVLDSVCIYAIGKHIKTLLGPPYKYQWLSVNASTGISNIRVTAYKQGKARTKNSSITVLSDIEPEKLGYKIIKTFPHDKEAYTQGLVYEDGIMYEGTGQYGESSLRKVKFESGDVVMQTNLSSHVFGEGVVIDGDRIIQLTWRSKTAFVFEKETFKELNVFGYPTEGWGITNYPGDAKRSSCFLMSDGKKEGNIYFLEKEAFTEISRIQVYDNVGPIVGLNELEWIEGTIFANVWQTSFIVEIDPVSGKVLSILDLVDLIPPAYIDDQDNVLNGIAYNKTTGHLYVTGKRWPKLYEIELVREKKVL